MPFKDKDDSFSIFPTRHGDPMGTAWESRMIQSVDGYKDIRYKVIETGDGTTVMLKTRAGMPDFTTLKKKQEEDQYEYRYDYGFVDTKYSPTGTNDDSTGGPLKNLVDENGEVKTTALLQNFADWKGELLNDLPTNYSGMMRRVAQVRHSAQELAIVGGAPGVPRKTGVDQFYFTYATSDGLWVDDTTGARWIIEIDSSGVYRIPITFVNELSSEWKTHEASVFADNDYPTAVNILTPYWEVKSFKRSDRTKIGDAPSCYTSGCSTWYSWLGWAFSYNGSAATIVCIRDDPTDGSWLQTVMYDMTITPSPEGVPLYVNVTAGDAQRIATNIQDGTVGGTGVFQVADTYPGVCSTISLYRPDCPSLRVPIFSYYTPSGGKRVFEYEVFDKNTNPSYENNLRASEVAITSQGWWGYGDSGPDPYNGTIAVREPVSGTVTKTESGYFGGGYGFTGAGSLTGSADKTVSVNEVVRRQSGNTGWYLSWGSERFSRRWPNEADPDGYYNFTETLISAPTWFQMTALLDVDLGTRSETVVTKCTVIMHGYDREAISFASWQQHYVGGYTETESVADGALFSGTVLGFQNGIGQIDFTIGNYLGKTGFVPPTPITVGGFIDYSPTAGLAWAGTATALHSGFATDSSDLVTTETTTRTIAPSTSASGSWYVSVGDTDTTSELVSSAIFKTYLSGDAFSYHAGASAFSGGIGGSTSPKRYFYSPDVTVPVTTVGIGAYKPCVYNLHNFVGVF